MIAFAYFLLKMFVCSGLLFGYYHIALRNKLFHQWNRFYLLASVIISIAVPCLQFNVWFDSADAASDIKILKVVYSADEYVANATAGGTTLSMNQWITIFYSLISISVLFAFARAIKAIYDIIKTNPVISIDDIKFVSTEEKNAPFSFLNYVVWNNQIDLESQSGKQIFQHELAHVREKHSFDKLFTQIVLTVFWCNPFFWLIQRELKMIHEFIADQKSVAQSDVNAFASMILQAAYPQHYTHLTNPFFNSSIKRRISMLTKNNNPRLSYLSRILALPLMAFLILAFTIKQNKSDKSSTNSSAQEMVEKAMNEYPQMAGPDSDNKNADNFVPSDSKSLPDSTGKGALVIIDGDEVGPLSSFSALDQLISPEQIEGITVLKGVSAIGKYGEKGKDGVIEITTKKLVKQGNNTDTTIRPKSIYYDGKNKIAIEADEITYSRGAEASKVRVPTALLIVNKERVSNDIFSKKTIIAKTLKFIEAEDAVKIYGSAGSNGVVELEGARYIDMPVVQYYKEYFKETIIRENPVEIKEIVLPKTPVDIKEVILDKEVKVDNNKIFEKVEKEATFPGGEDAWRRFLEKQLDPTIPVKKGAPQGSYTVIAQYIVHPDGYISDIKALTNHGYGMEEAVINLIKKGPRWVPAKQNGHVVRAYRKQPITFVVQEQ